MAQRRFPSGFQLAANRNIHRVPMSPGQGRACTQWASISSSQSIQRILAKSLNMRRLSVKTRTFVAGSCDQRTGTSATSKP